MPFEANIEDVLADETQTAQATEKEPTLWPVYLGVALLVSAWVGSIVTFGLPGLFLPPLMMVPVVVLILIRLAWG
jgi:hypothetical protein